MSNKFRKGEKLKKKKLIDQLFKGSDSVSKYPIRAVYQFDKLGFDYPARAGFSAPKRNFKKAVERNAIKRQMREAYRIEKGKLYEALKSVNPEFQLAIMFLYVGKDRLKHKEMEKAMRKTLEKLTAKLQAI